MRNHTYLVTADAEKGTARRSAWWGWGWGCAEWIVYRGVAQTVHIRAFTAIVFLLLLTKPNHGATRSRRPTEKRACAKYLVFDNGVYKCKERAIVYVRVSRSLCAML